MELESTLLNLLPGDVEAETLPSLLRQDPLKVYRDLNAAYKLSQREGTPFNFPAQGPVIKTIIADINSRVAAGSVLELPAFSEWRQRLLDLRKEGIALIASGCPERSTNRWIVSWVDCMEELLRAADPTLKGEYHRSAARGELEKLLERGDGTFIFFTFSEVDEAYFWLTRAAPIYRIGLYQLPPFSSASTYTSGPLVPHEKVFQFVDGYPLTLREFMYHDGGHSGFFQRRDTWLFKEAGYSKKYLVADWVRNTVHIVSQLTLLEKYDPGLARAVKLTFFEVIHERGYQYYLPILRQQLYTDKWSHVIRKKIQYGYWVEAPLKLEELLRLDEARLWLLNVVETRLVEDNLAKIHSDALKAYKKETRLKYWPLIRTSQGVPVGIRVEGVGKIMVTFGTDSGLLETSIYEVSLAQIATRPTPFLEKEHIKSLEQIIWGGKKGDISQNFQATISQEGIHVSLNDTKELVQSIKEKGLLGLEKVQEVPNDETFSEVELFKLEQVLTLQASGNSTEFTITTPPTSFICKVKETNLSERTITVELQDNSPKTFSMVEVSFQPL